ncbi:MAG: hypothetical protein M3Q71_02780 [Chloroflexota bacterium]|nr:hypothetical protein [Chloroflexota bacterium]
MSQDKDALIAELQERLTVMQQEAEDRQRDHWGFYQANPAPAVEEGPHLQDSEIARLKREQLAAYEGDLPMTADMQRLMKGQK